MRPNKRHLRWQQWGDWLRLQRSSALPTDSEVLLRRSRSRSRVCIGITQHELARRLYIELEGDSPFGSIRTSLAAWETGRKKPPQESVCAVIDAAFGLPACRSWSRSALYRIPDAEWEVVERFFHSVGNVKHNTLLQQSLKTVQGVVCQLQAHEKELHTSLESI